MMASHGLIIEAWPASLVAKIAQPAVFIAPSDAYHIAVIVAPLKNHDIILGRAISILPHPVWMPKELLSIRRTSYTLTVSIERCDNSKRYCWRCDDRTLVCEAPDMDKLRETSSRFAELVESWKGSALMRIDAEELHACGQAWLSDDIVPITMVPEDERGGFCLVAPVSLSAPDSFSGMAFVACTGHAFLDTHEFQQLYRWSRQIKRGVR